MTEGQRRLAEEIAAGPRGRLTLPFQSLIRSPEMATHVHRFGEEVRYRISIPERLRELAILVTARSWTAQYEWFAHRALALKAGLSEPVIEAVAARQRPNFTDDDERLVHDFALAVHERHAVEDGLYRQAVERFGEAGVVELVGLLGYYSLISMVLNVFEVAIAGNVPPPLKD
ncbi:MAG: carboxymuconolactone decarboxylase family protein [Proteobacteria bacterium]|nr:carboxymuconolactone decarboxylase family protein [Pseudomonadota bacterium]MBI3498226.1 carboxymuconolactone decarboxylase family protein [Pseudomonadota bacterium]